MPAPGHRSRAKAAGETWYFTGEPCRHGHVCEKLTADGSCRECKRLRTLARYHANPQAGRDAVKRWRKENPDKALELDRRNRSKRGERSRAKAREWRARNPDRLLEYAKRAAANPERRAKAVLNVNRWTQANKAKHRSYLRTSRSRRKGADGQHTAADVSEIMRLQRIRCAYCRTKLGTAHHVDHIQPLARGGSNDRRNLQMLCVPCNRHKAAKDPAVFARQAGLLI
jgi:5-methylcytosine-specific restriction endonuclease McrA